MRFISMKKLTEYAYEQMLTIDGLEIYGPPKDRRAGSLLLI